MAVFTQMFDKLQTKQHCIGNIAFSSSIFTAMSSLPNDTKPPESAAPTMQKPLDRHARHALYAVDQNARDTNAVFHVLDALEPPPGKQRMLRGGLMLLAGAFLIVAMGLLVNRYADGLRIPPETLSRQAKDKDVAEEIAAAVGGLEKQEAIPDAFAAMAASHLAQAAAGPDTNGVTVTQRLSAADAAQPSEAKNNTAERSTATQARKPKQASRKSAADASKTYASARIRDRNSKGGRQPERPAKQILAKGKAAVPDRSKRKDADVDLIAALLSRTAHKPYMPGNRNAAEKTAQTSASTEARSPELHASLGGRTANSDVVIRTPGDTTESLVKRCATLGLVEGQLCRVRICSGLWGKDAACPHSSPANLH